MNELVANINSSLFLTLKWILPKLVYIQLKIVLVVIQDKDSSGRWRLIFIEIRFLKISKIYLQSFFIFNFHLILKNLILCQSKYYDLVFTKYWLLQYDGDWIGESHIKRHTHLVNQIYSLYSLAASQLAHSMRFQLQDSMRKTERLTLLI